MSIGSLKKQIMVLLQPLRWCCVDCVIHHGRDVREEQKYILYMWRKQAIIDWSWYAVRSFAHMPLGISDHNSTSIPYRHSSHSSQPNGNGPRFISVWTELPIQIT